ncbi:periodic tryptophan protein 1 homolog [Nylanderia fulva]|uniref:periodic tryptophan protein 1 homolog n=1 Tax=Nylanderia fulva TaxID=613905 RepID=UPI0010FB8660|nr:periodic tryptophan protein 1 homolog [Nylanderia fulva]
MNVIFCTTWVKRGVAAAVPEKVELKPEELEEIIKETQSALEDEESDEEAAGPSQSNTKKSANESPTTGDEYNFQDYDDESGNMYCNITSLASFDVDGEDNFITNDDVDSENEDDIIKADDNLVLIGHVEGDASILEVFVYNEREDSFYCHHDILLSSFPLCIEWLNYDSADPKPGNLCAIGNMSPIIEIWDLDLIDCLEPAYRLGCKPNKKKRQKRVGHRDAVLDIAWNQNYMHVLASGSVDKTVLLWDLDNCKPVTKLDSFNEKIQALKWHPQETHQLLTGCADKFIRLFDCKEQALARSWEVSGEVERVLWNHYDPNYCIASTDNGYIEYFDVRGDKPLWQIKAHEKEVTGLSLSASCQGLLVSCSNDGVMKVWDILDQKSPVLVWEQSSNLGAIQCLAANPDNGFIFIAGGDNKAHNLRVLDFREIPTLRERFMDAERVASNNSLIIKQERVIKQEMMDVTDNMEDMEIENLGSLSMQIKKEKKET